ncbi:MAG: COX15/CtaA family protein, partial [Gammaproteobacteria bacterium]|nr:COX15/CtaA family protein [Gammaproteobacteria bacterium]
LGLLICALAVIAWRHRHEERQPVVLPILLVAIVIFQGLLGMWTVTLLLKPVIVMLHLMGGMTTVSLLLWVGLRQSNLFMSDVNPAPVQLRPWALLALVIVVCQIALGGWTSANYAALACPDFPTCQTQWWPAMNFVEGFTFWRGLGIDYEGGVLENDARVAVHMMHRIGALITFIYILVLSLRTILNSVNNKALRNMGIFLLCVLLAQVSLGIANIVFTLPLSIAVIHNGTGALLLLSVVALNHLLYPVRK